MTQIETHFERNRNRYLILTGGILLITLGVIIGKTSVPRNINNNVNSRVVGLINFKSPAIASAVIVPQGHPGFVVQCLETGEIFMSQNQAAKELSISPSVLSGHLNGKYDNAGGKTFARLGVAQIQ